MLQQSSVRENMLKLKRVRSSEHHSDFRLKILSMASAIICCLLYSILTADDDAFYIVYSINLFIIYVEI